ncbi:hypothetical protein [Salibacterium aidingense]|uniref:hypothetical protein n=1 Tax=Salibacterium aidingense TaxID=384933 RepID=UPI00040B83F1|nr:hypothetical protein [Salibacterium aidingense]
MQGYIKDYRKELDSDIWMMPPLYHRVWQYLKYKVNHKTERIPMKDGSFLTIQPGQHLTSKRKLAQSIGWYERMAWKEPNPKTISDILKWLEKQNMIKQDLGAGNRQYTLITLLNWEVYQSKEDEGNTTNLHQNPESGVNGNTSETEGTPVQQRTTEENGVTSNSHYTPDKQSLETNKNEKNEEEVIVVDDARETNKPIDPNQKDPVDVIAERYMDLKSAQEARPVYPSTEDYEAIARIVAQGVPTSRTIKLLEECFADFERCYKGSNNSIKAFKYCEKYIQSHFEADLAKEKARREAAARGSSTNQHAGGYGQAQGTGGASQSITGGQVGWIKPGKRA